MSGISQMQMLYVAEEDRILFRVNSTQKQEFRFWITRRYVVLLLGVLKKHMDSDPDVSTQGSTEAKLAVKNFKQEKALNEANFEKKFVEDASAAPLGKETLLAFKLSYNLRQENLHLSVEPKDGRGISLVISRQINSSLTKLILDAVGKAEWNLAPATAVPIQGNQAIILN